MLAGGSAALFFAAALLYAALGARPHLSGIDCGGCHLAGKEVKPEQASQLLASQEALCGKCHPNAVRVSHPSGFVPARSLPPGYPPDWKGDLTCSTCHLVHASEHGLLRGDKRGRQMCLSCHDAAFFEKMKDRGASIEQSGHLHPGIALTNIQLDPYSLQCMGCHGGQTDAIGVSIGRDGILRHASGEANHPIGKRYRESAKSGGFHAESRLSKKIPLPDGKISCVSCHQAYRKDHGKLVMSNKGSALCFQCHDI